MRGFIVLTFSLLPVLITGPAWSCATCLAGDPTITSMGTEKPFAGRKRAGIEYLSRGETVGRPGVNEHVIDEQRYTVNLSYAPSVRWIFSASLPLVDKEVRRFDLSRETASGAGDMDISARLYLGTSAHAPAEHLRGIQAGVRLPTSSEETSNGVPIDLDAQPGTGATIPHIGLWYGRYRMPWFLYASAAYQHQTNTGYQGYEGGDTVLLTGHVQHALGFNVAVSFSIDGRWRERDRYFSIIDDDSGGILVMATPGVAWTPLTDLVLHLRYQMPAIENLHGRQEEGPNLRLGVNYDF